MGKVNFLDEELMLVKIFLKVLDGDGQFIVLKVGLKLEFWQGGFG